MTRRSWIASGISALAFGVLTWFFLFRTDPAKIAERVDVPTAPYAILEVEPDSLQQTVIRSPDGSHWALQYSTRVVSKTRDCSEILITRKVAEIGSSTPFAVNDVPSRQLTPPTDHPILVQGSEILLPGPLPPGSYVFTVQVVCFDETGKPLGLPALTKPVCFRVGPEPHDSARHRRLLSEECFDQLSRVVVGSPQTIARHPRQRTWNRFAADRAPLR